MIIIFRVAFVKLVFAASYILNPSDTMLPENDCFPNSGFLYELQVLHGCFELFLNQPQQWFCSRNPKWFKISNVVEFPNIIPKKRLSILLWHLVKVLYILYKSP